MSEIVKNKDYNAEHVGNFILYKLMLAHLGSRTLHASDVHVAHYGRQIELIRRHGKQVFDKCQIESDVNHIMSVLIAC